MHTGANPNAPRPTAARGWHTKECGTARGYAKWGINLSRIRTINSRTGMKDSPPWQRLVVTATVLLQVVIPSGLAAQQQQPIEVVQQLYREVVAQHPMGVPQGAARKAIWPLLSDRLIHSLETRDACDLDWERRHRNANPPLKAPGFYEDGLFSGSNEQGYVNDAVVGAAKAQQDGSYLIDVNLWSYFDEGDVSLRTGKIYRWRVAARVTSEHGRFVVDDILGFKGVFDPNESVYMSKMLTLGCKGTHSIYD